MELSYELQSAPQAPGIARRGLQRELAGTLEAETVARLGLIVSELVTNSVVHGPGRPIVLRLEVQADGAVRGEVEDQGRNGVVKIRRETMEDEIGGKGLAIVDALADRWGVHERSTHVWFELSPE